MHPDLASGFGTGELDAELLATPFGVSTNWRVIGGAPSCGKTTVIELLAARGYRTVPEAARIHMEGEVARGRTIEDIHRDGAGLQRTLSDLQSAVENDLPTEEVLFLDGSLPTSLAWYRAFGLDPNDILQRCFRRRYAAVFVLDPLPLTVDNIRFDDSQLVSFIHDWIVRDHRALGYDVIRVPVLTPAERLEFILDRVAATGPSDDIASRRIVTRSDGSATRGAVFQASAAARWRPSVVEPQCGGNAPDVRETARVGS